MLVQNFLERTVLYTLLGENNGQFIEHRADHESHFDGIGIDMQMVGHELELLGLFVHVSRFEQYLFIC